MAIQVKELIGNRAFFSDSYCVTLHGATSVMRTKLKRLPEDTWINTRVMGSCYERIALFLVFAYFIINWVSIMFWSFRVGHAVLEHKWITLSIVNRRSLSLLPRSFCQQPNLKLSVSCRPHIYYMTKFLTDLNASYSLNARSGEFLDIDLIDTLLAYNT